MLVLCAGTAIYFNRAPKPEAVVTDTPETDVTGTLKDDVTGTPKDDGIGMPGGDLDPEQFAGPTLPVPGPTQAPPADKPDLLVQVDAALDQGDINNVIALLNQYLNGNPQGPWRAAAESLRWQATTATDMEMIETAVQQAVDKLTDDQLRDFAVGKAIGTEVNFPFGISQFTDPRLYELLKKNANDPFSRLAFERATRKPGGSQPAVTKTEDSETPLDPTGQPAPDVDQPDAL